MIYFSSDEGKEVIYTFVSLLIVFIMFFSYDLHIDTTVRKSRVFIFLYFILLIFVLFIVFGICFILQKKNIIEFSFNVNILHNFTNIFRIVGLFVGVTGVVMPSIIWNINSKLINPILQSAREDISKVIMYSLAIIFFYLSEFNLNNLSTNNRVYLLLLFSVCCIGVGLILGLGKNKYQNFYNKDEYGFLCVADKFKDVSLDPLICPRNKLK